jgi:hypothetical protein
MIEKFKNWKSLIFHQVALDNKMISMISRLSLEFICLKYSKMTKGHLQEIFETCIALQKIQLVDCCFSCEPFVRQLPPQLKKLDIKGIRSFDKLDTSKCTRLESL